MKTLAGSYFMCSPYKYTENDAGTLAFLGHQKHFRRRVSLAVSSQIKHFHTISAASSALPSADTQTTDEIVKLQEIDTDQPKTVHVRFKLQKECAFGEQFLIVGDDPIIGSWEPSDGVPLNWGDGHVWTAELDMPSGKVIKYKFLLKGENGIISWQSGPDRSFETWNTDKMITVLDDWDDPELQNIVESDLNEEILVNSDLIVDENLSRVMDEETNVEKELVDTSGFTNIAAEKPYGLLVAENIVESVIDQKGEITGEFENRLVISSNMVSSDKETVLVSDEGTPVLVPGLTPMAPEDVEETMEREDAENTSIASDEVEESSVPELKEAENVSNSFKHPTKNIEEMIDKKSQVNDDKGQLENSVLERDKQWGRQTVQKFLASLGFQLLQ